MNPDIPDFYTSSLSSQIITLKSDIAIIEQLLSEKKDMYNFMFGTSILYLTVCFTFIWWRIAVTRFLVCLAAVAILILIFSLTTFRKYLSDRNSLKQAFRQYYYKEEQFPETLEDIQDHLKHLLKQKEKAHLSQAFTPLESKEDNCEV